MKYVLTLQSWTLSTLSLWALALLTKRQSGAVSLPPAITSSPLPDLRAYLPNPPLPCSTATPVCQTINVDTPEADATQEYPWPASSPLSSPFASFKTPNLRPPMPTANILPPSPQKRAPHQSKPSKHLSAASASTSTPPNFSKYAGKRPADNDGFVMLNCTKECCE